MVKYTVKKLFLYPGQGSQYPGMGLDLYYHNRNVKDLFAIASDVLHTDVVKLLESGTEHDLMQTDRSQVLIMLVSLSASQILREKNINSDACAGFSLGEYAALVDAGVLKTEDAFHIVHERGRCMEHNSRKYDQDNQKAGMAAVIGKSFEEVKILLHNATIQDIYCAIATSPLQTSIAGTAVALTKAQTFFREKGLKFIPLKVSGPFHTPLMEEAADTFRNVLNSFEFFDPQKPVYSNVHGKQVHTGSEIKKLCVAQLISPVLWVEEEKTIMDNGYNTLYETGPGKTLTGLWHSFTKGISQHKVICRTMGTLEEIRSITHDA